MIIVPPKYAKTIVLINPNDVLKLHLKFTEFTQFLEFPEMDASRAAPILGSTRVKGHDSS